MTIDPLRRFDRIEKVVADTRRSLEDTKSTVMARLASHTHGNAALDDLEVAVNASSDVEDLKAALLAYISAMRA